MFRTDRNNNPTAFTTDIALEAHLVQGMDYDVGDPFTVGTVVYHTAKLLKDPVELTITVINAIGFYTISGVQRWTYIGIHPGFIWDMLTGAQKKKVIGFMYSQEGGTAMKGLFV